MPRRIGPVAAWLFCRNPNCSTELRDPIEWAAAVWDVELTEAVRKIDGLGLFTSKRATAREVLVGYVKFARARAAWDRFVSAMWAREVTAVTGSDVHARLGIADRDAHDRDRWWATSLGEIDAYLAGHTNGSGSVTHRVGGVAAATVLAVPVYWSAGDFRRVVGVWVGYEVSGPGPIRWAYVGAYGESGGLTSLVRPHVTPEAVTFDPDALLAQFRAFRGGRDMRCELVGGHVDAEFLETVRAQGGADLQIRASGQWDLQNGDLFVAARTGCLIDAADGSDPKPWHTVLYERAVMAESDRTPLTALGVACADVDWGPLVAKDLVATGRLTCAQTRVIDRAAARASAGARCDNRTVDVRRGLTVEVTAAGWVWKERGTVLLAAVPTVTRTYRDETGKVAHMGHVTYGPRVFSFHTRRFRRDAAAVIEAAVLRGGYEPPCVDPVIVPHIATVALYLRKDQT